MPIHTVEQGECMTSIARQYGFADPKVIYDHPDNEGLRKARPDMNVLHPGDAVAVPDPEPKKFDCGTDKAHKFQVKRAKRKLKIVLLGASGKPMEGIAYELVAGDQTFKKKTGGDGAIEHDIDARVSHAELTFNGVTHDVNVGHLNPTKETDDDGVSGVQARLHNLGYTPGDADGELGPRTFAAICAFQRDHDLEETGAIDDALLAKLEKAHGC